MVRGSLTTALVIAFALSLAACSSPPPPPPPPEDTGTEFDEAPIPNEPDPMPVRRNVDLQTIYFDFDRSEIRSDQQPKLRSNADQIESLSGAVTIQGHTDARGSEEYNLALGERRARSVKRYLVDLGVSSSKLKTVSYGEAREAVAGTGESVWSRNRRAEFASQ